MSAEKAELARLERAITRAMRGSRQRMARRSTRLEGAGYILLTTLETSEPARMSDLATALRLDASTISRQVRYLEDVGMLRREPDPDDGRASRVLLSDRGRAELSLQRNERHAVFDSAMSDWNESDRATLVGLMERLANAVESPPAAAARDRARSAPPRRPVTAPAHILSPAPASREVVAR